MKTKKINQDEFLKNMKDNIKIETVSTERIYNIINLLDTLIANVAKKVETKQLIEDIIYIQYLISKVDKLIPNFQQETEIKNTKAKPKSKKKK